MLAEVMTDKATVELPSPVHGVVRWLGAEVGDIVAVGCRHRPHRDRRTAQSDPSRGRRPPPGAAAPATGRRRPRSQRRSGAKLRPNAAASPEQSGQTGLRPRRRCGRGRRRLGIDLAGVSGSGPDGGSCTTTSTISSPDAAGPAAPRPSSGRRRRRGRGDQDRRAAAQHRRADAGVEAADPPLHVRRGGRRHRARGAARPGQHGRPANACRCCRS